MTLTQFLLARITEDEQLAMMATPGRWSRSGQQLQAHRQDGMPYGAVARNPRLMSGTWKRNADHIARHEPARVLTECESKRRIIALHQLVPYKQPQLDSGWETVESTRCLRCTHDMDWMEITPVCDTLKAFVLPYANHPDYREEWRL